MIRVLLVTALTLTRGFAFDMLGMTMEVNGQIS